MLSTSKTSQNLKPVVVTIAITLAIWLGNKWYFNDWFDNPYKYPAKAASLAATVILCWCVLLSTRNHVLEKCFHGLDKVYQIHKRLGKAAFAGAISWRRPLEPSADPLAYYSGAKLGATEALPTTSGMLLLAIGWGVMTPLLVWLARTRR